jgi:hypothetical protein
MASTSVVFDIIARDRASDKFDNLGKSVDGSTSKTGKFSSAMSGVARVAGPVALGLGAVAGVGVKLAQSAASDAAAQEVLRGALERNAGCRGTVDLQAGRHARGH